MMSPVLVMDDTIAFSQFMYQLGETVIEWPHMASWTPYGYFVPLNAESADVLDFLEYGPHSPYDAHGMYGKGYFREGRPRGFMIDFIGRVYQLDLDCLKVGDSYETHLHKHRILTGPGTRYVFADTVLEHEKAMMAMRICKDLDEALPIYLDNTLMFQHKYEVFDIQAIADELKQMGLTLTLP